MNDIKDYPTKFAITLLALNDQYWRDTRKWFARMRPSPCKADFEEKLDGIYSKIEEVLHTFGPGQQEALEELKYLTRGNDADEADEVIEAQEEEDAAM